ncbi:hypothetical protein C5C42_11555 [Rathayibacter sp. AY1F7]|nr:hypothetical protein C5C54_00360 [Rathayibacter sp. AY1F2]PPH30602.1 hypothetical protein C5C37_04555 [Rathayibacter sp. AY1F9]PPH44609.1 hypothetical protein C5C42_11555 [Rathayibacter sp. AY1F7]
MEAAPVGRRLVRVGHGVDAQQGLEALERGRRHRASLRRRCRAPGPPERRCAVGLPEVCVVYVLRDGPRGAEVLLGRKRRGLGEGRVVAPGGKLEPGESPVAAAVRELQEEAGLVARAADLEPRGVLDYSFPHRPAWSQRSHVFLCRRVTGEVTESSELAAAFVPVEEVPFERMWDDARLWLPGVLRGGAPVRLRVEFGADLASVASWGPADAQTNVPATSSASSEITEAIESVSE